MNPAPAPGYTFGVPRKHLFLTYCRRKPAEIQRRTASADALRGNPREGIYGRGHYSIPYGK